MNFLKIILLILIINLLTSCYTNQTIRYKNQDAYAIFQMKNNNINENFTNLKQNLKLTYDFWGRNLIVVLENIGNKTIFIDLNNSKVTTGHEKLTYNDMIAGNFDILPLESGQSIELDDFFIINNDNEEAIKKQIKKAKDFKDYLLVFKYGDYPINLKNIVKFGYSKQNINEFEIIDNFYSERVKILKYDEFEHLIEYGSDKLYNKTFYQTKLTQKIYVSKTESILQAEEMIDLFFSIMQLIMLFTITD